MSIFADKKIIRVNSTCREEIISRHQRWIELVEFDWLLRFVEIYGTVIIMIEIQSGIKIILVELG